MGLRAFVDSFLEKTGEGMSETKIASTPQSVSVTDQNGDKNARSVMQFAGRAEKRTPGLMQSIWDRFSPCPMGLGVSGFVATLSSLAFVCFDTHTVLLQSTPAGCVWKTKA